MTVFTLKWKGPMASQVGARIDGYGQHQPIPSLTAVSGLLGAALGLRIGSAELRDLTDALRYAVVVHKPGHVLVDYQTADLTAMPKQIWWNTGREVGVIQREGSAGAKTRRVQHRPLAVDVDMTLIVELSDEAPWSAETILSALDEPRYALCLGRENCPPSGRVAGEILPEMTLEQAVDRYAGVAYLPIDARSGAQLGWGDLVVDIPSRDRSNNRFRVVARN